MSFWFNLGVVLLWSATYVMIIVESLWSREKPGMPWIALALNLSWEAGMVISSVIHSRVPYWGHAVWLGLDLIICILSFKRCGTKWKLPVFTGGGVLLHVLFLQFPWFAGVSVFTIDLIMAIAFLWELWEERIRPNGLSVTIGFLRLSGDFCAWVVSRRDLFMNISGAVVLLLNLLYVAFLIMKVGSIKKDRSG